MNKTKVIIGLLLVFLSFNFTACEDEPVDPALLTQVPDENACTKPNGLAVSAFNGNSVVVTWTASEGAAWEIQYGLDGFVPGSGTSVASTTLSKTISGLTPTNNYDFYVRTLCSNGVFSGWYGPVAVGSNSTTCTSPTNFTALRSSTDATKANLLWNANGDETSWEIQYGASGFAIGSGTTVASTTTIKSITGLLATSGYDFYVRSNCSATDNSLWTGPVHINQVGGNIDTSPAMMTAIIDGVSYNAMQPYAYPATSDVQVENEAAYPAEPLFLWIQGDTNVTGLTNQREIDLHIPNSKWMPGTYNLLWDNGYQQPECWAKFILLTTPETDARNITGTITVTEFNVVTKRIKGSFQFTYEKYDENGVLLGTFQVTNGTFNYGLDDDYFN